MELYVIAIIPWIGARHRLLHRWIFHPANTGQLIAQDFSLGFQLLFIRQVLVMTASTDPEMLAARKDPMRRGLQNFHQFAACKATFFFDEPNTHSFTRQAKRHKDR